ncbi:MAG: hypothetical protein KatS3mg097_363 [Candidatus Parcubacteria bacterium]|nr:MAG: hypothetical protein KatS3mg097_363 [Candidatus Parcubacteria bacterium]
MFFVVLKIFILNDLKKFLDFWFIHGPKAIIYSFFDFVYALDKGLSLRANIRNFFAPLYGDHTILGHIIALVYRLIKLFFGLIALILIVILYGLFFIAWSLFPFIILLYGFLF